MVNDGWYLPQMLLYHARLPLNNGLSRGGRGFESRHSRHFLFLKASETRRFRGFYVPVTAGSAIRARFGQWLVFRRRFFSLMESGVAMARRRFVFRTTA